MAAPRTVADTGLAGVIVPRTPRALGAARPIDCAYREIDALGGWFDPMNQEAATRDELLGEVLAILARYGAVDPDLAQPQAQAEQVAA